jgi:hypothetical protein
MREAPNLHIKFGIRENSVVHMRRRRQRQGGVVGKISGGCADQSQTALPPHGHSQRVCLWFQVEKVLGQAPVTAASLRWFGNKYG